MAKKKESSSDLSRAARTLGRVGGKIGGPARARALSPKRREEIAREGGKARQRQARGGGK